MLPIAILAGGLATRLRPITESIPKALIEINGTPFIDWQLKLLSKKGITKVVFCVAHKSEMIQEFVGTGERYGIEIEYSEDGNTQLGTGGAIRNALNLLGQEFMVLYGDSYLPIDYKLVQTAFINCDKPALMSVYKNAGAFDTSNVIFENGQLETYRKGQPSARMTHIDYGLSIFKRSVFEEYQEGAKLDLSDICTELSSKNLLAGYEVDERFYEIGSYQGIEDFEEYIRRQNHDL
jgi:MurNAc alpha-1-phosphate uridylyltransferase